MVEVERRDSSKYQIPGIDSVLVDRVCLMLKAKWQLLGDETINMPKMMEYYNQDRETLERIIHWYESNLLAVKFKIYD